LPSALFSVDDQERLIAIARAAAARKCLVLVEASQGQVEMIGLRNLNHSPSVKVAKAAIDAGFEFIHIDLSPAEPDTTEEEIMLGRSRAPPLNLL
jgi:fructose-bisphosphate aldolase class II